MQEEMQALVQVVILYCLLLRGLPDLLDWADHGQWVPVLFCFYSTG